MTYTKEEKLAWQKQHRQKTSNRDTKKYEKTKKGFLMRCYRNMLSRVKGISPKKHLYQGKDILNKQIFYQWSLDNQDFNRLFQQWIEKDYPRTLTPSIDRIDNTKSYLLQNIRWVTFSENCCHTRRNEQQTKNLGSR